MRRIFFVFLAGILMLLCACSAQNQPMQKALDLRSALLQSGGCTFTADCNVNYDQTALRFSMQCTCQTDGKTKLTLDSPETLRGITACTDGAEGTLSYEDTVAAMPLLDDGTLSPLTMPYLLACALSSDYISCAGAEEDTLRITYLHGYDAQELCIDVWLDAQSALPCRAEISKDGTLLLAADLSDFTFTYETISE